MLTGSRDNGDRGKVDGLDILSVNESNNEILIKVDGIIDKDRGESVDIRIDETRRDGTTRSSTLRSTCYRQMFLRRWMPKPLGFRWGKNTRQSTFRFVVLTDDMISHVERICNDLIGENLPVKLQCQKISAPGSWD